MPVMMGYVPLGAVFGFLLVQQGASWWLAPLMSLLVFAGAAQFLAIGLLAIGTSVPEIVFAVFIVNLRHIFYGISVRSLLPENKYKYLYCIHTLTDENYSLLSGLEKDYARKNAFSICFTNHFYWTISAAIGALIGESSNIGVKGLDFAITALFTVLAIEQYRRNPKIIFLALTVVSYLVATLMAPNQTLFAAIVIAISFSIAMTSLSALGSRNSRYE